ncbi:4-hydroxyphenylacetate 3-hydroxylase N-terminal domain-containing protein [Caballeronia temeraria]|uniref:4-hydroxyphenylacetate 3-hydroxylase N-terminal domain-containing protein n=1 Tax=Caballeronia temeraria TaxID=1777137 RepID=UPI001FC9A1B3|nr:4-hydroxyphenylacetate 3-hydroxylase N-terminal domain-containing protein [Caballeronia temeraria]
MSHALITPQNDRSKQSSEQASMHLRVVKEAEDGIYVSGARMIATLGPALLLAGERGTAIPEQLVVASIRQFLSATPSGSYLGLSVLLISISVARARLTGVPARSFRVVSSWQRSDASHSHCY